MYLFPLDRIHGDGCAYWAHNSQVRKLNFASAWLVHMNTCIFAPSQNMHTSTALPAAVQGCCCMCGVLPCWLAAEGREGGREGWMEGGREGGREGGWSQEGGATWLPRCCTALLAVAALMWWPGNVNHLSVYNVCVHVYTWLVCAHCCTLQSADVCFMMALKSF